MAFWSFASMAALLSGSFDLKNPDWSYQHTKSGPLCTSPSIDIYDSPHLIVDTPPRKVVQGSYLFTVDLASCPSRLSGFAFPSLGIQPSHRGACRWGQVPAGPNPRSNE